MKNAGVKLVELGEIGHNISALYNLNNPAKDVKNLVLKSTIYSRVDIVTIIELSGHKRLD